MKIDTEKDAPLRIESDGTGLGTRILDKDGNKVEWMSRVKSLRVDITGARHADVRIDLFGIPLKMTVSGSPVLTYDFSIIESSVREFAVHAGLDDETTNRLIEEKRKGLWADEPSTEAA